MTTSTEQNGRWNFINHGENEYFVVCVGTPELGAELHLDNVQGDDVGGGMVFMPNIPVQIAGQSTLTFFDGHPDVVNTGFVHVSQRSGVKNHRPAGRTVMTAGPGMVYMCIMPRTKSSMGGRRAQIPRVYNSIVMDYDVIEADGDYTARANTYYVPVLGGATVQGATVADYDAYHVSSGGPTEIILNPGAKVIAVWLMRGRN